MAASAWVLESRKFGELSHTRDVSWIGLDPEISLELGIQPMATQEEIFGKIRNILVEALSVDDDQVTPQARLQADLDAQSIDFLEIVFRLEREFGLKIERSDLFPDSIVQGDPRFVQNGLLTAEGLVELKEKMPYADISKLEKEPKFELIGDLFTVDLITRYIDSRLQNKV